MARRLTNVLTPYADMIPSLLPSDICRIFGFKKTCVVDMNCHTCSCGKWSNLGISCDHAIAAPYYLLDTNHAPSSLSIRMGNTRPFDVCFVANCVMENIIIGLIFVTY
uniref:SWIM-type domain-containing protein n=1 Tax=Lactuca sativa TaxID=4236 RepID=A0A9R1WWT8_LACSA|nr:hypothetical protein LSAT_V11C800413630 [Lactuca sativa]